MASTMTKWFGDLASQPAVVVEAESIDDVVSILRRCAITTSTFRPSAPVAERGRRRQESGRCSGVRKKSGRQQKQGVFWGLTRRLFLCASASPRQFGKT
jgi:hypothetical protein